MKKFIPILFSIALLAGCGGGVVPDIIIPANNNNPSVADEETEAIYMLRSNKERDESPDVSDSELDELVAGNNEFATDMYQKLRNNAAFSGQNIFFSPYGISVASAMLYAGAQNNTKQQMKETFHFTLTEDVLHQAFNKMDLELKNRSKDKNGNETDIFRLTVSNSFWGQKNHSFLDNYLDALSVNYDAGIGLVDFATDPVTARTEINTWIKEQTNGRFKEVLSPDAITKKTRLVLVNALYFNALWADPFPTYNTADKAFNMIDGTPIITKTMRNDNDEYKAPYADGDGYKAVKLYYQTGNYKSSYLYMLIIVPDEGEFYNFESALDYEKIDSIARETEYAYLDLSMPKFDFESNVDLSLALMDMGMKDAFTPSKADFQGIDGTKDLYVQGAIHKAFVKVNEKGTEAGAASGYYTEATSLPPEPISFVIDRPFIFMIRDATGAILFMGRVLNPAAS